jgi:hypothetical protein
MVVISKASYYFTLSLVRRDKSKVDPISAYMSVYPFYLSGELSYIKRKKYGNR